MIKQISKVIFWSAVAILFCFIIGNHGRAEASDDHIVINEIYSNQISDGIDTEWIELYDPNNSDFDLNGYSIVKITSSGTEYKKPLSMSICLKSSDYYVCDLGVGWLANSGSTVVLRNNSIDVDKVVFGALKTGQSISRIPNGKDTDNGANDFKIVPVTKGAENIFQVEEEPILEENVDIQITSIADARQKEAGIAVIITGTVTIPPNQLSAQYFYIQDDSAGIQIYCYKKDFPALTAGDIVQVEGEISDYYSDKRVKINLASNIIITGHQDIPVVKEVIIDEISDNFVGQIVTFEGTVSETSGSIFYVEGSGEIKVNIREETNIDKPRMSRGDMVKITGVVSRHKDTYQILPFEQSGVTILTSGKLPSAGKSRDGPRLELLICLVLWNIEPEAKLKLKKLLKKLPKVLSQVMSWR